MHFCRNERYTKETDEIKAKADIRVLALTSRTNKTKKLK